MSWLSGLLPNIRPTAFSTVNSPTPDTSGSKQTSLQDSKSESSKQAPRRRTKPSARIQDDSRSPSPSSEFDTTSEKQKEYRAPYWQCMLAGGVGGSAGDMLMHSIDTVKTRQQGDPHIPPKYRSLGSAYLTILRQEGFARGLYSGVTPAFLGSFPGTLIFFGTYECSKRNLIDGGLHNSLAYLASGFIADLAASVVYVPSEVLKTRLQLQGRYNNPHFASGYNYRGTIDAARTIIQKEGLSALFHGYKATIWRDLPFSALQFAFYEQEQTWAKRYVGGNDIGLGLEIATATTAGGLAGVITCPLDVVKTRVQTQINAGPESSVSSANHMPADNHQRGSAARGFGLPFAAQASANRREISSTARVSPAISETGKLNTSSVITGLRMIYNTEGIVGLFRGVGPRGIWTSVQSGTMLVLYQILLKKMATQPWLTGEGRSIQ